MKDLPNDRVSKKSMTREIAATLRVALDRKYDRVFRAAQPEWERKFAGKDPSNACVRVRISGWVCGTRADSFVRDFQNAA